MDKFISRAKLGTVLILVTIILGLALSLWYQNMEYEEIKLQNNNLSNDLVKAENQRLDLIDQNQQLLSDMQKLNSEIKELQLNNDILEKN